MPKWPARLAIRGPNITMPDGTPARMARSLLSYRRCGTEYPGYYDGEEPLRGHAPLLVRCGRPMRPPAGRFTC